MQNISQPQVPAQPQTPLQRKLTAKIPVQPVTKPQVPAQPQPTLQWKLTAKPQNPTPTLRFTPTAWAKLLFMRDRGDTEVGGFGICPDPTQPLLVTDIVMVEQDCTSVSVKFDDASVADFFDTMVDEGLEPKQFARVWIHTHPGNSAQPSGTDEETFTRVFGKSDWAVMFILAEGGDTYTRLRFNVGPGGTVLLSNKVDFGAAFAASDREAWEHEYQCNVTQCVEWVWASGRMNGASVWPQQPAAVQAPGAAGDAYVVEDDAAWMKAAADLIEQDRAQFPDRPDCSPYDAWANYLEYFGYDAGSLRLNDKLAATLNAQYAAYRPLFERGLTPEDVYVFLEDSENKAFELLMEDFDLDHDATLDAELDQHYSGRIEI